MTRKKFLAISAATLAAPFVYAFSPQSVVHTVKMEAPRNLIKDMHTMWLGAIDCRSSDAHPGKIWVGFKEQGGNRHVGLQFVEEAKLPEFLKTNHIFVKYELIEALAIAWMDAAANYDRRMTNEEYDEFIMQMNSFFPHPEARNPKVYSLPTHNERLALNLDKFSIVDKFYKGKFKTPMQEQIAAAIQFNGAMDMVIRIYKTA